MKLLLFVVAIVASGVAGITDWKNPYLEIMNATKVSEFYVHETSPEIIISFTMEENVGENFQIGKFLYNGTGSLSLIGRSEDKSYFKENLANKILTTAKDVDYESEMKNFEITVTQGNNRFKLKIQLKNLNDNSMILSSYSNPPCRLPEKNTPGAVSQCTFKIVDKDGIDESIAFIYDPAGRFEMTPSVPDIIGKPEATLTLKFLKEEDFETENKIILDWTAKDDAYNDALLIVIQINDVADMPPVWNSLLGSIEIDELEESDSYEVEATDGDLGIKSEILYSINCTDNSKLCQNKIKMEGNTLKISRISLDDSEVNTITFDIIATEKDDPHDTATQTVVLLIKDINNNAPKIDISINELKIDEHDNSVLKTEITIEDKDSADFGTYQVSLTSTLVNLDINNIIQIIPNTGYKKGSFTLSVLNPKLLDYDNYNEADLRDFVITIHSKDNVNDPNNSNSEKKDIRIILNNINDEIPKWDSPNYKVKIKETFGRDAASLMPVEQQETFFALDNDVGKYGDVSYAIVGKSSQKILELKNANPPKGEPIELLTIHKPGVQIFDYEYQEEVLVSIMAKDYNDEHVVITQLTVQVEDVNDEFPMLTTSIQATSIEEDTENINAISDIVLTATDADKTPDLEISIDWNQTYAMKLGKKLTDDFDAYKECFKIVPTIESPQKTTGILELDPAKSPNYNIFDTIYLNVLVTDKNGEVPTVQTATLTLIININNMNNQPPEFDLSTLNMEIKEHSDDGIIVGIVKATDPDNLDEINFEIIPSGTTPADLVKIQPDGKVVVTKAPQEIGIEADPDIFELKYKVKATDTKFETEKNLTIKIIDANDNSPEYVLEKEYFIEEHSAPNWDLISVTDFDRDAEHSKFQCQKINNKYFETITKEDKGCEIQLKSEAEIDRDGPNGIPNLELSLTVYNHLDHIVPNVVTKVLKVTVNDINDNSPNVKPGLVLQVDESFKENTEISALIEGEDIDEGVNANLTFELKEIKIDRDPPNESPELKPEHFKITPINDKKSRLTLLTPLMGLHGDYNLYFLATDQGTPPKKSDVNENPVKLHVKKYNNDSVIFVDAPKQIMLSKDQTPNAPLNLWSGGKLKPIEATDQQGGKYDIRFELIDENGGAIDDAFFRLNQEGSESTSLQLKTTANLPAIYNLKISAQSVGAVPETPEAHHDLSILVLDADAAPIFSERTRTCKADEEFIGVLEDCDLPDADYSYIPSSYSYNLYEDSKNVYYHIHKKGSLPDDAYAIKDNTLNKVSVEKKLDLQEYNTTYFTVEASPSNVPKENPNENSLLVVTLELNDINNHPPVFDKDEESFLGIMLIGMIIGDTLMSVKASDPDADSKIEYDIVPGSYKADESLPPKSDSALYIAQGELKLNFKVQSSMTGRMECVISATDGKFTAEKEIELYVISDVHLTSIVFDNALTDVEKLEKTIIEVLEANFACRVGIKNSYEGGGTTYDEETTSSTEVIAYFIDTTGKVGIGKDVIKSKMNNIAFYAQLRDAFVKHALLLRNVITSVEEESLEETYKLALIIVAVVSGVLLIALIGFFTYKIRSQNNRLDRMYQAEARRPTMIQAPNLPGANRRATQVVNPNFMSNKELDEITDDLSFTNSLRESSFKDPLDYDDEDFVGVENNDIFKINPLKRLDIDA